MKNLLNTFFLNLKLILKLFMLFLREPYAAIGFMASLGVLVLVSAKVDRTYSNRIELLVTGEQIDAAIAKRLH